MYMFNLCTMSTETKSIIQVIFFPIPNANKKDKAIITDNNNPICSLIKGISMFKNRSKESSV